MFPPPMAAPPGPLLRAGGGLRGSAGPRALACPLPAATDLIKLVCAQHFLMAFFF